MSYIINNTSAFVNIKLTEVGRQKLAQGQLNFNFWAIGDSEINYDREDNYDLAPAQPFSEALSGTSKILRPVDQQPDIKHFITSNSNNNSNLNSLDSNQIKTIKAIVNNVATERGFFSGNSTHTEFTTKDSNDYIKYSGTILGSSIAGGNTLVIDTATEYSVGDFILLKIGNDTIGNQVSNGNTIPTPHLWYKIQSSGTTSSPGDTITLDRELPNINSTTATTEYIIYTSSEVYEGFGHENTTPYWNSNTLDFAACCDVSCADVPVWNMNNVWCENLAGMTGASIYNTVSTPNESYEKFGSNEYMGQKFPYFEYKCVGDSENDSDPCANPGDSVIDSVCKSISILHYTNNTISNYYGEYLYIDGDNDKNVKIHLPDLMYHRRNFSTESGTTMGMTFIASGETKLMGYNNDMKCVDLIEDPTMVSDTPRVVGKVYTQLKTVVFDEDEIVAAMSYKSNRNWTLPHLSANMVSSSNGASNGILQSNETMYLTYTFENSSGNGLTTTLPCQYYTKITNNTSQSKDVEFRLSDIDMLPYMRKEEKPTYDGMGFSAREFKVLYQIVSDINERPIPDNWSVCDFTSSGITTNVGETIDPKALENQNPLVNNFIIDFDATTGATTFSIINSLNMAPNNNTDLLQFGDERFFYGNLETCIGATIFKTIFNLDIDGDDFKTTGNPTMDNSLTNSPDIRVSEIGIYDTTGSLVMIGKLSKPVTLESGKTIMLELAMDF
tara:strand:- start:17171 stop:19351 length:2181 start_codon:yes stop_codon:yes gene_type:complete